MTPQRGSDSSSVGIRLDRYRCGDVLGGLSPTTTWPRLSTPTTQWITKRTGIKQRRIIDAGMSERHLAKEALTQAIERAGIEPEPVGHGDLRYHDTRNELPLHRVAVGLLS